MRVYEEIRKSIETLISSMSDSLPKEALDLEITGDGYFSAEFSPNCDRLSAERYSEIGPIFLFSRITRSYLWVQGFEYTRLNFAKHHSSSYSRQSILVLELSWSWPKGNLTHAPDRPMLLCGWIIKVQLCYQKNWWTLSTVESIAQ